MTDLQLSIGEPFTSPAWGSNLVVFSSPGGESVPEEDVKEYIAKACRYAKHYRVYLVPERFYLMNYHSMALISPEGKVWARKKPCTTIWHGVRQRSSKIDLLSTEFALSF